MERDTAAGTMVQELRWQSEQAPVPFCSGGGAMRGRRCHSVSAVLLLLFGDLEDLSSAPPSPTLVSGGPQTLRVGRQGPPFRNPHCLHHRGTELQNIHPLSTRLASCALSCLRAVNASPTKAGVPCHSALCAVLPPPQPQMWCLSI